MPSIDMIALDLPGTRNGIGDCKGRDGFLNKIGIHLRKRKREWANVAMSSALMWLP